MAEELDLTVDPEWVSRFDAAVPGIYVRARNKGRVGNHDIAELDKASLLRWLKSRGGDNPWCEDVVGILLGHGHLHE